MREHANSNYVFFGGIKEEARHLAMGENQKGHIGCHGGHAYNFYLSVILVTIFKLTNLNIWFAFGYFA